MLITSGCETTLGARLDNAAISKAVAEKGADVPELPPECRRHFVMPNDPMGDEPWVKWRGKVFISADAINNQIDNCAQWNDDIRAGLSAQLDGGKRP